MGDDNKKLKALNHRIEEWAVRVHRLEVNKTNVDEDLESLYQKFDLLNSRLETAEQLVHKANIELARSTAAKLSSDDAKDFMHHVVELTLTPPKGTGAPDIEQKKLIQKVKKQVKALSK